MLIFNVGHHDQLEVAGRVVYLLNWKTVPFTVKDLLVLGTTQVAMVMVWRHVLARVRKPRDEDARPIDMVRSKLLLLIDNGITVVVPMKFIRLVVFIVR